jgi:hypothetical protein
VDPADILWSKVLHLEVFWIFFGDLDELVLLLEHFLPLLKNAAFDPVILNQLQFLLLPKDDIIDLLGQISDQVVPLRFLSLLVLEQEVGEENPVFPVRTECLCVEFRILLKDS